MTEEQRAELRRLAAQAVHFPPMSGPWLAFYAAAQPGVVLELLDAADKAAGHYCGGRDSADVLDARPGQASQSHV